MNDYKELVAELKELAEEEKEFASNSGDIYCAEKLALTADAIEQLVKERDAAIADLKQASKIPYGGCHLCTSIRTEICKECYRSDMFAEIAKILQIIGNGAECRRTTNDND